ncbi:MAG TPA: site-specific DNA-methyltransferase [Alphaproteobacteria bacterium]|nr:site-specific DNA-methyltransferase [Alphaproteobacteria bacterium]
MTSKKQKLELTWIGKEKRPKLEPRILLEDAEKSYHAKHRVTESDIFDNALIFGDNLLALKALEQEYTGKVKCVFIDPPYNTGSAFTHYDDGIEHSIWLGLMKDRLEILRNLLRDDGSIWITIDDNEAHYLKVMCDEIFGRNNFVRNIVWQKKYTSSNDAKGIPDSHDHILVYKKTDAFERKLLPRTDKQNDMYKYDDKDGKGRWRSDNLLVKSFSESSVYPIKNPNTGKEYMPPEGSCWRATKDTMQRWLSENRIYFGKDGKGAPQLKRYLNEVQQGVIPNSWWPHEDGGHNDESKKELKAIFGVGNLFDTPKPERLIHRILTIATEPGDLVLDSFAGSGTTGAVAHKMGRKWIMVELGEHCHTHIIPRLTKVINGEDQGGISKAVNWKGGGGFRYYSIAPSMLERDKWGNWVISKQYDSRMLTQAMCKIMGFKYEPSDEQFWAQGKSSENDFIYVTTQTLDQAQLQEISDEVGENRSLLICCFAFRGNADEFKNLTIKKIPRAVLTKCEWGKDDYSLNIKNLPMAQEEPAEAKKAEKNSKTLPLFSEN